MCGDNEPFSLLTLALVEVNFEYAEYCLMHFFNLFIEDPCCKKNHRQENSWTVSRVCQKIEPRLK